MRILTPRRVVALAAGAVFAVFMATPAAAVGYSFDIDDGLIEVTAPNSDSFEVDFDGTGSVCPDSSIDVDFTGGVLTVTDVDTFGVDTVLGDDYYVNITDDTILGDSQTGAYSSGTISGLDLGLRAAIYESDVADCVPDTLVCTFVFDLDLSGTYTGTAPSSVTGGTLTGGSGDFGLIPDPSCDAPFATYIDGTVEILESLEFVV